MSLEQDAERSIATKIAAMLIAVATFSLTLMGLSGNGSNSNSNEIFGILGLSSLLISALLSTQFWIKQIANHYIDLKN